MTTNLFSDETERKLPVVFDRDGVVMATSRDVADYFGKRHDHVLRDIDNLLKSLAPQNWGAKFREIVGFDEGANRDVRYFEMTRDGFVLLAMGFTGNKALEFKLKYLDAFNRMEAALKAAALDPADILEDPAKMRHLLLTYTEKVIGLQAEVADLTPKAEGLDRIATADGSLCLTDAAKTLQVRPKALMARLSAMKWIYRRAGNGHWCAYQERLRSGCLEHKITEITHGDGSTRITEQVRVTGKGLAKLARDLSAAGDTGALI